MAISISSINPPPSSATNPVASQASAPFVNGAQPPSDNRPSTVVTLSAQGQQLNQAQNGQVQNQEGQASQAQAANTGNATANVNTEAPPKEMAAVPGIRLITGESKGGRVNTFA